jgi:hypothetical protein
MLVFKFLLIIYVQYNFYMRMSRVTSSHFAKYFCDICSEYITPFAVMTYATSDAIWATCATSDAIWAMPPWLCTLWSRATVWTDRVGNTMDNSQEKIS